MRIKNVYKRTAALIFLMVAALWPVVEAWGQEYGDKYSSVVDYSQISINNYSADQYVSNVGRIFDNNTNNYATISSGETGSITVNLSNVADQIILNFYRNRGTYYTPQTITVLNDENDEIGSASGIGDNTSCTIDLNQSSGSTITLKITAEDGWFANETRITGITFQAKGVVPSIQHKPAKWYTMRSGSNFVDTFDDEHPMFKNAGVDIQSAHTYVDTLYVKKGSPIQLLLPTLSKEATDASNSAPKYQRWYNYETEGTFATGLTGNNIIDLLTPPNGVTAYRFQNGYVAGNGLLGVNSAMSGANFYYPENGKDKYVVACDISGYTDFTKTFSTGNGGTFGANGEYIEPTLSLRVLYVLVGIDNSWKDNAGNDHTYLNNYERLNTNTYQGGKNDANKAYLEEYNIVFPCDHISDHTDEAVAIAREAQYYRIPGDGSYDNVSVQIVDDSAGLELIAEDGDQLNGTVLTLDEGHRVISFRKSGIGANTPWSVDEGSQATILVTKTVNGTTYNIARFNLTFQKNTRLLTQHQIDRLDKHREGTELIRQDEAWFNPSYLYRTPKYLDDDDNYILLTSRTFDYDKRVMDNYKNYIQENYYAFPLDWGFSSYAFFDGSTDVDFNKKVGYPEWGSYGIMNDYKGYGDHYKDEVKPDDTLGGRTDGYFIYVDASSRPGRLATLTFDEKLCAGSELLVSAWVKSSADPGSDDAAMLFTIYGVDKAGNRTPIHSQSTGQIRKTKHFSSDLGGEYTSKNGYGSDYNDWYQIFMSFVNDDPSVANFESYELRVDNNCASTVGGDYYLDEIKVYIAKPLAEATQLQTACADSTTLMTLHLDWDRFMARVGDEGKGIEKDLGICFIDTLLFHNNYTGSNMEEAIKASAVHLGQVGQQYEFRVLKYNTTFKENKKYDDKQEGSNLAVINEDKFYGFDPEDDGLNRALAVDFYGSLIPGRTYWVVLQTSLTNDDYDKPITDEDGKEIHLLKPSAFRDFTDICAIKADFHVTGNTTIKIDGEIVTPKTQFCKGHVNNFTVELQVPYGDNREGMATVPAESVSFDWFFGESQDGQIADPQTQYVEENTRFGGVTLRDALRIFRNLDPSATALDEKWIGVKDGNDEEFTRDMYDLINYYLNKAQAPGGAQNRPLVLHQPSLNITLLDEMRVVICPIPLSVSEEVMQDLGYDEESWKGNLCWGYTYLELKTTDAAPSVHTGFNLVAYPDQFDQQAIRIGLDQINRACSEGSTLTIDLRGARSADEEINNNNDDPGKPLKDFTLRVVHDNYGLIDKDYSKIYLIGTNDPEMLKFLNQPDVVDQSYPIGKIDFLEAHPYGRGGEYDDDKNKMMIWFDLSQQTIEGEPFQFIPREGYSYTFKVFFEELNEYNKETACIGELPVIMKVVPKYMEWVGQTQDGKYANWNNDDNWKRITYGRIQKTNVAVDEKDYFTDGGTNDKSEGFVPMLFSKVIMPKDSKVELYAAGYNADGSWGYGTGVTAPPDHIAAPTDNIQYDLMAFESGSPLKTERYRVSLLDEIHFEPGAEMLHSEYLIHNKAYVDYKVIPGKWYSWATPIDGVVAGDFYTDDDGNEKQEYFTDIKFDRNSNNRFKPSVYQRMWKGITTAVPLYTDATPNKNVAISGNWSALTNDVAEKYEPGKGFSLKVQDVTEEAIFRLPKADTKYNLYHYNNGQPSAGDEITIARFTGSTTKGNLVARQLYNRHTDIGQATEGDPIKIELSESATKDYYLVGNPFMAHLDMDAFLKGNSEVIELKYWAVDDGIQNIAVVDPDTDTSWTTQGGATTIAPLQSFFVQKKTETSSNVIKFTQEMQTLGGNDDGLRSANALTITATTSDGRISRAAVAYDMAASADYETSEDAELFLDSNLGDVPMVYTVAGTMAASINRTSELYNIPLGVYGNKQEKVTLSFGGLNQFSSATLYDAQEQTETPLREGKTVSVPAGTSGRYFLRAGTPTGNEVIARNAFLVYSVGGGKVMVTSSNTPLKDIRVYTMGGAQVRSIQASGMQQEIYLNRGIYLITVSDQDGLQETRKVLVR